MAYITKKTTVDGIKPIGSNLFGTCSTASGTAQKDVVMADFDVLVSGVTIHVEFANANTASNPTLKVGSTSAVAIKRNGTLSGKWGNGAVISFTYDGTNWVQNDADEGAGYRLSKSGSTITLTGSDGSTSSVTDANTTYGISVSGGNVGVVAGGTTASKQYLHVSSKQVDVQIAASFLAEGSIPCGESGYTPIGVVGWNLSNQSGQSGVSYVYPFTLIIDGNYVYYQLRNTSSSEKRVHLLVRVLYIPS
jgi:hypothetical protein